MPADSSSALHRAPHTRQTHIEVIVDVHLEDVLDDVPELALLQPEPLRDERDVARHGDGGQLPREVGGELAVGEDGGLAALSHGLQCCHVTRYLHCIITTIIYSIYALHAIIPFPSINHVSHCRDNIIMDMEYDSVFCTRTLMS